MIARAARHLCGIALGALVRIWLATLRLKLIVDPKLLASMHEAADKPWVLSLWHGQQMPLLTWARRRRTVVLVSRSLDGELLCGALSVLGYHTERGSSSQGGSAGLISVVRRLRTGFDAAFALDGPRGPRRVVKALGACRAALLAKGFLVPMGAACARAWMLQKTWDHFEIPMPFSRIVIALGAPIACETAATSPDASSLGRAVDAACEAAQRELEAQAWTRKPEPASPANSKELPK